MAHPTHLEGIQRHEMIVNELLEHEGMIHEMIVKYYNRHFVDGVLFQERIDLAKTLNDEGVEQSHLIVDSYQSHWRKKLHCQTIHH